MKTLRRSGLLIVIVVAALMAAPMFGLGAPAFAQCTQAGSTVTCDSNDPDGFISTDDGLTLTVDAGVTVSSATGDAINIDLNSTVINNGTVSTTGDGNDGVQVDSGSTVTNNGGISTTGNSAYGVYLQNAGSSLTNDGTISTSGTGAYGVLLGTGGDAVTNNGTIVSSQSEAIGGRTSGSGADTIVNSGTVTGNGTAINTRDGDDSVELTGSAPVVNGDINGGLGTDTLIFSFDVLDTDYAAVSADIAAAAPAGGSLTYNGRTYSWLNFEQLVNLLNQVATGGGGGTGTGGSTVVTITIGGIGDGRLNGMDLAATAVVYCGPGGTGLDVYSVTDSGVEFAFRADLATIEAGLAAAPAEIVSSTLGASLFATDSTHLQVFGLGGYTYGFEANVCGLG